MAAGKGSNRRKGAVLPRRNRAFPRDDLVLDDVSVDPKRARRDDEPEPEAAIPDVASRRSFP